MIDEEKLIKELFHKMPHNFGALAMDWFRDLIESQPKIGGWIACSERLPDTRNNVLICQNDGYVSIGYYSQEKFLDLNSYPFNEVIA